MRALLLAAGIICSPGCLIDIDFDGTEFRCTQEPACPPGHECVGGVCVLRDGGADGEPDAGVDADVADADVADADLADADL